MIYLLRFLPEVEEDVFGGYTWYEEKAFGLGEEFIRMFYSCAAEIAIILFCTRTLTENSDDAS